MLLGQSTTASPKTLSPHDRALDVLTASPQCPKSITVVVRTANLTRKSASPDHADTGARETPIPLWFLPDFCDVFTEADFVVCLFFFFTGACRIAVASRLKFPKASGAFRMRNLFRHT
jgi:hypothetical protein